MNVELNVNENECRYALYKLLILFLILGINVNYYMNVTNVNEGYSIYIMLNEFSPHTSLPTSHPHHLPNHHL